MAGKPAPATAHETVAERPLPAWLRAACALPGDVLDPAVQVFLESPAPVASLWAMVRLAAAAELGLLRVRRDHGTNPNAMDPARFVIIVVYTLRNARDDALRQTAAANRAVVNTRLDAMIDATNVTLTALMDEPPGRVLCDNPTCPRRGRHLRPGPWEGVMARSKETREDVLRLCDLVGVPEALPNGVQPNLPKTRRGFQRLAETTTRDQPILAALNSGKSYRTVARECGVGKSTVERVAKAYGLTGHAPEPVPLERTLQENLSIHGKPRNREKT